MDRALTEDEVKHICMSRWRSADTFTQKLQKERQSALESYMTEPQGDEIEGQSQFVTSDVRDTIEWILPSLVEMFIGDENPVTFSAKDEEDVEAARVESDYVRNAYNHQNEGFLTTYTWAKDGLLSKNGVVKSYWDERVDEVKETYRNKTYVQYIQIMQDQDIEVEAVTINFDGKEYSLDELEEYGGIEGFLQLAPDATFDIDVTRKEDVSQVRVENIPPENFFVDRDHPSLNLDDCSFCCHGELVTESDLLVDGYSKELVQSIPTGHEDVLNEELVNRHKEEGSVTSDFADDSGAREVYVREFYIRIDMDGNGKTELRMVKLAGPEGSVLLENEVVDSNPFSVWTPVINPHKHYGMSMADLVMPIQRLKTAVTRGMLDNIYLTNNPTKTVIPNLTYMEDILEAGPGAVWRVKDHQAIQTHVTPFMGEASLGVLGLIDKMREERTGVSGTTQGLNPSDLSDSTNLVGSQIMSQALQRVKMIARIFAETGFKHLMGRMHELCMKYDDKPRAFQHDGQFVTVDPREWTKRKEFSIKVGVGHADKMQRMQAINAILLNHEKINMAGGLGGPLLDTVNVHEALVEQAKLLGYTDGAKFYRDPKTYEPPPPKDPLKDVIELEGAKATIDVQKEAVRAQMEMKKHQDNIAIKEKELAQKERHFNRDASLEKDELVLKYGKELNARKD